MRIVFDTVKYFLFMEMNIRMRINCTPQLSPTFYNSLQGFMEFKSDLHHIYIRAYKEPIVKWNELPYLTTDDIIFNVFEVWLP